MFKPLRFATRENFDGALSVADRNRFWDLVKLVLSDVFHEARASELTEGYRLAIEREASSGEKSLHITLRR
jgi:hypothetical protein